MAIQIKKILLPVDGSDHSMHAAQYATDLARIMQAEIVLLHSHKPFPVVLGEPYFQNAVKKIMKQSNALLEPYRVMLKEKEVSFTDRIMEGHADDVIVEVAKI